MTYADKAPVYEWFQKDSNWLYCHSHGALTVAEVFKDPMSDYWVAYDLTGRLSRKICEVKDLQEAKIAVGREFLAKANV